MNEILSYKHRESEKGFVCGGTLTNEKNNRKKIERRRKGGDRNEIQLKHTRAYW
jgi:hypothetical protein